MGTRVWAAGGVWLLLAENTPGSRDLAKPRQTAPLAAQMSLKPEMLSQLKIT